MPSSCESSCETLMSNLTEVNAQKLSLPLNSTFEVSRAETIGKSGCGSLSNRQNCGGAAVIVSHVSQVATQAPQNQSFYVCSEGIYLFDRARSLGVQTCG